MPPRPSSPGRAGGSGLHSSSAISKSSFLDEPGYSDEDIGLLFQVVREGENILPTLPEEDRLPTIALFQASEKIFPRYGYDPDDAPSHLSRLLFKVGGHRQGETLMQKFESVLGGMDIVLDFTTASVASDAQHSVRVTPPRRNSTASESDDPTATPLRKGAIRQQPGLRYYSISEASPGQISVKSRDSGYGRYGGRTRSVSLGDSQIGGEFPMRPRHPQEIHDEEDTTNQLGKTHSEIRPFKDVPPAVDPFESYLPGVAVRKTKDEHYALQAGPPPKIPAARPTSQETIPSTIPESGRLPESTAPSSIGDTDHVAQSTRSDDDDRSDVFRGASDTTVQTEHLGTDLYQKEIVRKGKLAQRVYELCSMRDCLGKWMAASKENRARTATARRHILRKRAFEGWEEVAEKSNEDEQLAQNFVLNTALGEAAAQFLHLQHLGTMAEELHENYQLDQMNDCVDLLTDEYRGRLADELRTCRLGEDATSTWQGDLNDIMKMELRAIEHDKLALMKSSLNSWRTLACGPPPDSDAELDQQEAGVAHGASAHVDSDMFYPESMEWAPNAAITVLDTGRHQHSLQSSAQKEVHFENEPNDEESYSLVAPNYANSAKSAHAADIKDLEGRLLAYQQSSDVKLAQWACHSWTLQARAQEFERDKDADLMARCTDIWDGVYQEAQARRLYEEDIADQLREHAVQWDACAHWLGFTDAQQAKNAKMAYNAELLLQYRAARPILERWKHAVDKVVVLAKNAETLDFAHTAHDATRTWCETAQFEKSQELLRIFRAHQKQSRKRQARDTVLMFEEVLEESSDLALKADALLEDHRNEDLATRIQLWSSLTQANRDMLDMADAKVAEVVMEDWIHVAAEQQENFMDATEYAELQDQTKAISKWEFEDIQLKSLGISAGTLRERNDRRTQSMCIEDWRGQINFRPSESTMGKGARASIIERRHLRQQMRSGMRAETMSYTPATTPYNVLGPMEEFEEQESPSRRIRIFRS